jgi:hypothetical protein
MQAARHRWNPLDLRIQATRRTVKNIPIRPQGVARAARSTLLALLQNERSMIERTISSGYMRGVGTEAGEASDAQMQTARCDSQRIEEHRTSPDRPSLLK